MQRHIEAGEDVSQGLGERTCSIIGVSELSKRPLGLQMLSQCQYRAGDLLDLTLALMEVQVIAGELVARLMVRQAGALALPLDSRKLSSDSLRFTDRNTDGTRL